MAGFQDQLVGPAPYVETLPVDAYTRVGMIKQEQYDKGVEKVQGYIDSVAGIEALMPEQKDYLNKTVNQLQSQVQQIAGSDFSNSQVVNSVGHLTKQMAADPIIQNTVYATNAYRSESAKMKEAQDSGKSSPANEYVFQRGVQNWLGSHDPSKSFDASYNPYVDYKGKMVKALNAQLGKPDENEIQDPFKRGPNGQHLTDDHGQPIPDYATLIEKYKGVSAERIKNIVDSTLDENDKRQIAIDGQYEYRGYGKPELKQLTDSSYKSRLDQINGAIQGIQVEKMKNSTDVAFQNQADEQIKRLSDQAGSYQQSYLRDIDNIDKDTESYKSSLYGQNWLAKFSEGYSYAQHSLSYGENYFFKNAQIERENNIKFDEFQETRQFHYDQLKQQKEIEDRKLETSLLIAGMKGKKGANGEDDNSLPLGVSLPEPLDVIPDRTEADFTKEIDQTTKDLDLAGITLLSKIEPGKDLVKKVPGAGGVGIGFEWEGATEAEKIHNRTVGNAIIKSLQDGTYTGTPEPQVTAFFNQYQSAMKNNADKKKAIQDAQNLADNDPSINTKIITKNIKPLYIEGAGGTKYTITPDQMISFNKDLSDITVPTVTGNPGYDEGQAAYKFKTPATKFLFSIVNKPDRLKTASDRFIISKLSNIHDTVNQPYADRLEARDAAMTNILKNVVTRQEPVSTELIQFKGEDKHQAITFGAHVFSSVKNPKSQLGLNYKGNEGLVSEMLKEKNAAGTRLFLVDRGDGQVALRYENEAISAGKPIEINLTPEQVGDVFGSSIGADTFLGMTKSINLSRLSKGTPTTNVQRQGATTALPLNNGQFKNYNVKFDVEEVGDQANKYQIKVYAYNKQTGENKTGVINFGKGILLTQAQVAASLANINDETINRVVTPPAK